MAFITCPFCSCGCGLYLQLKNGKPFGVSPSENHPVSRGRLCARGWHAHQAPVWGERLTRPMIRDGGGLRPVSWEEALETAARGISAALTSGKNVGVLGSARGTNEENYLAAKLGRDVLHTRYIDSCLSATYHPMIAGIAEVVAGPPQSATLDDLEKSDVIILPEGDLARTHPHVAFSILRALKHGAKLVTLGWVRTQLSRQATLHIPMVPGMEGDVLSGLVAAAVDGGFAEKHPEPLSGDYATLRNNLSGLTLSESVRSAAEWFGRAERAAVVIPPIGISTKALRQSARALTTLAAVTGHLGRPGSMVMPLPVRWNLRGACEMGVVPEYPAWAGPLALKEKSTSTAADPEPANQAGVDAQRMMAEVSALILVADDPASVLPMGRAALEAMTGMECVVAFDSFSTSATEIAHVVLPIAGFAETDGTSTNLEGRVQRIRPSLAPPGEARPGWQGLAELAGRLGARFSYESFEQLMREIAEVIPTYAGIIRQDEPWGVMTRAGDGRGFNLPDLRPVSRADDADSHVLTWDGVFDWGREPLVAFSPILNRDYVSQRKLFPGGTVEMSKKDADGLGVRQGWQVRLTSVHGEVVLPVMLRTDLEPGVLLMPYALRDKSSAVLGTYGITGVRVERI